MSTPTKFCEECGSALEPTASFCDNCGSKQEAPPAPKQTVSTPAKKQKKKNPAPFLILALFILLGLLGIAFFFLSERPEEESNNETEEPLIDQEESFPLSSILQRTTWLDLSETTNHLLETTLAGSPAITIDYAFSFYQVESMQYGQLNNQDFLYVQYVNGESNYKLILNLSLGTVEEVYIDDVLQTKISNEQVRSELFDIVIPFAGTNGSYQIDGAVINLSVEGNIVRSTALVSYFEETLNGYLTSENTAEVYLSDGNIIIYEWTDSHNLFVKPQIGFDAESQQMAPQFCDALTNTEYQFKSEEFQNSPYGNDFVALNMPLVDVYYVMFEGDFPLSYTIEIHSTTNNTFTFSVYEHISNDSEQYTNTLIDKAIASFHSPSSYTATYENGDELLTFFFYVSGEFSISDLELGINTSMY